MHVWNVQHTSAEDVEDAFNSTMEASDNMADGLAEVSGEIKRQNKVAKRKAQKVFDTIETTSDTIKQIQEEAARQTEQELEDFFQGIANA